MVIEKRKWEIMEMGVLYDDGERGRDETFDDCLIIPRAFVALTP